MGQSIQPRLPATDAMVAELYGSLSDDATFRAGLTRIGEVFRSHLTSLHFEEPALGRARLEIVGAIESEEFARMCAEYSSRWAGRNLWIERGMQDLIGRGWGCGDDNVGEGELRQSEYYRYFLHPADVHHGLGINVQNQGVAAIAIVSFNRSAGVGAFTQAEKDLVAALRPHLVNAYAISRRILGLRDEAATLRSSFDQLPLGMLVLEANGRVAYCNEEASALLRDPHAVALGACGSLVLASAATRTRLKEALARLSNPALPPTPEAFLIGGNAESNEGALVLHLCALPVATTLAPRGRVLAFLSRVNRPMQARIATRVLQLAFDLTPAEATVTHALREHHDPLHVALELGLAISTVRSHLKHVFAKTGTDGQRELLRLVDCLLSAVRS
jgi:DNA-binding CsgD family transcriptional regulator/PAS domain-containing protein